MTNYWVHEGAGSGPYEANCGAIGYNNSECKYGLPSDLVGSKVLIEHLSA